MKDDKDNFISKEVLMSSLKIGPFLTYILMFIMRIHKLNRFYRSLLPAESSIELFQKALKKRKINVDVDQKFFEQLPDNPFIIISNHVFGFLDGMILVSLIGPHYPYFKITANYLIGQLDAVKDVFISVIPYDEKSHKPSGATKLVLESLKNGNPIGFFPAGGVGTYYASSKEVIDRPWMLSVFRIIQIAQVPVLPVFFKGTNSRMFHLLGKIHPLWRTFRLIKEFFKKKDTTIRLETGEIIAPEIYNKFSELEDLRAFFRKKVYELR